MDKFNPTKYKNEYTKSKYDRIEVIVPSGEKEKIKKYAEKKGMSTNAFITSLIQAAMK